MQKTAGKFTGTQICRNVSLGPGHGSCALWVLKRIFFLGTSPFPLPPSPPIPFLSESFFLWFSKPKPIIWDQNDSSDHCPPNYGVVPSFGAFSQA